MDDGKPTKRYHDYRDSSRSKAVMALREAYGDLFHIREKLTDADRAAVTGKLKSTHNASDRVAEQQATTFFALLKHADLDTSSVAPQGKIKGFIEQTSLGIGHVSADRRPAARKSSDSASNISPRNR